MVVFEAPQVPVGQHPLDCGQHPGPSPGLASPLVQHTVHPADARRAKQGHSSVSRAPPAHPSRASRGPKASPRRAQSPPSRTEASSLLRPPVNGPRPLPSLRTPDLTASLRRRAQPWQKPHVRPNLSSALYWLGDPGPVTSLFGALISFSATTPAWEMAVRWSAIVCERCLLKVVVVILACILRHWP